MNGTLEVDTNIFSSIGLNNNDSPLDVSLTDPISIFPTDSDPFGLDPFPVQTDHLDFDPGVNTSDLSKQVSSPSSPASSLSSTIGNILDVGLKTFGSVFRALIPASVGNPAVRTGINPTVLTNPYTSTIYPSSISNASWLLIIGVGVVIIFLVKK